MLYLAVILLLFTETAGFVSHKITSIPFLGNNNNHLIKKSKNSVRTQATVSRSDIDSTANNPHQETSPCGSQAVRAPLKFIGPYPCLGLKFPTRATQSQRQRNVTGVSLDFVIDTAANINTINGQVAQELGLSMIGKALPGLGAGGAIEGGNTYLLGDCELEGLPMEEELFIFMQDLTASALPVASPAAAGLLSLAFLHSFEGGVEFQWGSSSSSHNNKVPPSVTFYGPGESDTLIHQMTRIPIKELPVTRLPSVQLTINGVTIPALLDTGSPITVMNAQAAEQAGIQTVIDISGKNKDDNTNNDNRNSGATFFANIGANFQQAKAVSQAAARGDLLTIAGSNGERVDLVKSSSPVDIGLSSTSSSRDNQSNGAVDFGSSHVYVGNLPGLAALNALGDDSPPAAVLGMDVLRSRPNMLFLAQKQELYF